MNLHDLPIDKSWTLFLDRDGVINRRIVGDYVKRWEEFIFLEGVLDGLKVLERIFGKIVVVSNQQGVGKGLVSMEEVSSTHERMVNAIAEAGGRIDRIYFSPHLEEMNHPDRKPGIGMALKAKNDFPDIVFERSVMVGDSKTDMQFGRNIGAINVLIGITGQETIPKVLYDFHYPDLHSFSSILRTHQ